jgi:hypothetical protein
MDIFFCLKLKKSARKWLTHGEAPLVWLTADWSHSVGGHGVAVLDTQLLQCAHRVPRGLQHQHIKFSMRLMLNLQAYLLRRTHAQRVRSLRE